jgi:hypothetical protein
MVDRGRDFTITKRTEFDALTHKPLSVRYTLNREGLPEPRQYARLAEAREDSGKPLEALLPPPPPPPPEPPPAEVPAAEAPTEAAAATEAATSEGASEATGDAAPEPPAVAQPEGETSG